MIFEVFQAGVMFASCALIFGACICRLYMLNPREDKPGWAVMYGCMLVMSISTLAECANHLRLPTFPEWMALAAIGLNLILTHQQWLMHNKVPPIAKKTPPETPRFSLG